MVTSYASVILYELKRM